MNNKNNPKEEKHLKDIINAIPYSALEKCAFIMISIFMLFPLFRVIIMLSGTRMILDGYHRLLWYDHNRYVLLFGSILLAICVAKLIMEKKLSISLDKFKNHPSIVLFGIFSILMIISTVSSGLDSIKLNGVPYCGEGLTGCLSYMIYFLLAAFIITDHMRPLLLMILAFSATINFVATLYDKIVLDNFFDFSDWGTLFYNSNHYGYYILIAIMLFAMLFLTIKKTWLKILNLDLFMFSIIILLLNNTFGCQIALLVTIIFVCIVYSLAKGRFIPQTLFIVGAFIFSIYLGYTTSDTIKNNINGNFSQFSNDIGAIGEENPEATSGVFRLQLWEKTLEHIAERPLLGFGADGTYTRLLDEVDAGNGRAHSDYLHYAVCFGIPAAIIYVAAVFLIYLRGLKYKNKLTDSNLIGLCVAFAHLVSAAVGNSMFYTTPFLFIFLGLGYYKERDLL